MKCFYHSADLDGHCSGALVKREFSDCEMIGINYGEKFPWERLTYEGEVVFMADFSLTIEDMMRLAKTVCLVWIDHHVTAIDEAKERGFDPDGLRRDGIGACQLVAEYLHPQDIPYAVRLLAEYDVWNHSNVDTLPFQYGMRFEKSTLPENQDLWVPLFSRKAIFYDIFDQGKLILEYEKRQNAKKCHSLSFESVLYVGDRAYRALCCNAGMVNSMLFDSMYDLSRHELMIAFYRRNHLWAVSLYTTKEGVHCGEIAKIFDGGGHRQAAGFVIKTLPFEY